jgi:hypothetical protein
MKREVSESFATPAARRTGNKRFIQSTGRPSENRPIACRERLCEPPKQSTIPCVQQGIPLSPRTRKQRYDGRDLCSDKVAFDSTRFAAALRLLPEQFRNGAFIGQHGSWNRNPRSGYKVIFVPFTNGRPADKSLDVLTGFIGSSGEALGRPVGVGIDRVGSLLVADDVGNVIWRVTAGVPNATLVK